MPEKTAKADGRSAGRRLHHKVPGDPTRRDPSLIVAAPPPVLPGESAPLEWAEGRAEPVTEEEALGVLRRQRRYDLAERYDGADTAALRAAGLPDELEEQVPIGLPCWSDTKPRVTQRFPPRLWAMLEALAELEGTNVTSLMELTLYERSRQAPRGPARFNRDYLDYAKETVGVERKARLLAQEEERYA